MYREGYSIGGKTGTAEKQPRDKENYVVSFLACAPAEKPEIMVYVVIDSPNIAEYDSSTAAQIVASSIMDRLMPYYGIGKDYADYEVPLVHVNTSEDKKNGELVVSSDGIIVVTGERFMPTRDEIKDEEGDEPNEEGEDKPEESQGEDSKKDDSPDDSPDTDPEEGESGEE